ncbi:hypothetical protein, partial [Saccharopolyspora taberi]|uniref:hypothetical protein n=1 Tax=Saccharopolyspora taberi TaxID=60895 RepID=UPI0031D9EE39
MVTVVEQAGLIFVALSHQSFDERLHIRTRSPELEQATHDGQCTIRFLMPVLWHDHRVAVPSPTPFDPDVLAPVDGVEQLLLVPPEGLSRRFDHGLNLSGARNQP